MVIQEPEMLSLIRGSKKVFLLEPKYRRKYPPLGLAKIATFAKRNGAKVEYGRDYDGAPCDLICCASLFTYESRTVSDSIARCAFLAPGVPILVGGPHASLMPDDVEKSGAIVFAGYSRELDSCVPDSEIDWSPDPKWADWSFVFTSRGCANRCPYCAVWRIEGTPHITGNWKDHARTENVMVSDNNLTATSREHIRDVTAFFSNGGHRVVFDNGIDVKCVDDELAGLFGRVRYAPGRSGLRLAFDRIEEDGIFQDAVKRLLAAGVAKSHMLAYVLFNFHDSPGEADYRMRECVRLGIRPYPQRFTPLRKASRNPMHVGDKWTIGIVRAFRHFWLFQSLWKIGFRSWVQSKETIAKFKLTEIDLGLLCSEGWSA